MDNQIIKTDSRPAAPGASWRQGPAISVRRYGQNDFERFDEESARGSHLCVGHETLGKVNIDCKYHWTRSQWGILGGHQRRSPAGVVYMDIAFHQPSGYWLETATVYITLGEDDASTYALAKNRKRTSGSRRRYVSQPSEHAVQIAACGPSFISGEQTRCSEATTNSFVPTFGAAGFEVGGMGRQSTSVQQHAGSWTFRGAIGRPEGRAAGLRTLRWDLTENALAPEQPHRQEYKTAFAFEHSRRPVYMRVEIEGRLRSRKAGAAHGLARFSSGVLGHRDRSTLTHMDFGGGRAASSKRLDEIVKGLDMAMQMENDNPIHEVRGPAQARFFQEQQHGPMPSTPAQHFLAGQDGGADAMLLRALRGPLDGSRRASSSSTAPSPLGFTELGRRYRAESTTYDDDVDMQSTTAVNSEPFTAPGPTVPKDPAPRSSLDARSDELLQHPGVMVLIKLILAVSSLATFVKWLLENTSLSWSFLLLPSAAEAPARPRDGELQKQGLQPEPHMSWKQHNGLLGPPPRPPPKPIYEAVEELTPRGLDPLLARRRNGFDQAHALKRALENEDDVMTATDLGGWSSA